LNRHIEAAILNFWKIPTRFFRVDIYDTFYHGYDIPANRLQLQNVRFKKKIVKNLIFFPENKLLLFRITI